MKKGTLTCLIIVLLALAIPVIAVGVMFFARVCPPQGPWPMPPWCGNQPPSFAIPQPPAMPELPELPVIPTPAPTPEVETMIEKAVVVPADITKVDYPEFYNSPTISSAVVKNPYCAITQDEIAYPADYLGDYEFPPAQGAPLPQGITRTIGIKDVWIPEPNLNDCPALIPYAPMRQALDATLARVKALSADEITFTNYIAFEDFEKPILQTPEKAAISESDLRYFAGQAEKAGLGMTLYLNLAPGSVKVEYEIPSAEWLASLIEQWKPFALQQARLAQETGIDAVMINHFDYQPGVAGYEDVYQSEMLDLLAKMREVYSGKILFMIEPVWGADLQKLDGLLNAVDGFIFTPNTTPLRDASEKTVSVANLKGLYADNLRNIGGDFGKFKKPFLLRVLVQSEKDFLEKGWNEDMFCIERNGDPCYQKNLTVDFSVQAVALEAFLEAVSKVQAEKALEVNNIDIYGYWFTDVILPDFSQPQIAQSIRNKPAEALVFQWFKK